MKNKEICKKLLEIILDVEIEYVEYAEEQKTIGLTPEAHGIRLDVYVKDGKSTVYNVEMQVANTRNDVFGQGRPVYSFQNYCKQDKELELGDGTTKVFLNARAAPEGMNSELGNFLRYLTNAIPLDEFTLRLDAEVCKARENKEWRREFMTLEMKYREKLQEGFRQGMQQGKFMTLYELTQKDVITVEKAAEMVNMTEEEFLNSVKMFESVKGKQEN